MSGSSCSELLLSWARVPSSIPRQLLLSTSLCPPVICILRTITLIPTPAPKTKLKTAKKRKKMCKTIFFVALRFYSFFFFLFLPSFSFRVIPGDSVLGSRRTLTTSTWPGLLFFSGLWVWPREWLALLIAFFATFRRRVLRCHNLLGKLFRFCSLIFIISIWYAHHQNGLSPFGLEYPLGITLLEIVLSFDINKVLLTLEGILNLYVY